MREDIPACVFDRDFVTFLFLFYLVNLMNFIVKFSKFRVFCKIRKILKKSKLEQDCYAKRRF